MPKNLSVIDILPKNQAIIDISPKNTSAIDILPKMMKMGNEINRGFSIVHSPGNLMLSVPLLTYSVAGTEVQWSEIG